MRKFIFTLSVFCLVLMSYSSWDCTEIAYYVVNEFESLGECLSSEQYNRLYNYVYDSCINGEL